VDHRKNYDHADAAAGQRGDCAGRFCDDDGDLPPRRGWGSDRTGFVLNRPKPTTRKRRVRKPRIDTMIKRAERAGKNVTSVTTPEGVTLTFGGADKTEADQTNDLDKWMAKRHAN